MGVLIVGMNHRTAPVELREQLTFSREGVATALMLFRNQYADCEVALISTCNRVEMIVATDSEHPDKDDVVRFIAQARDLPIDHFQRELYTHNDEHAVRHFLRVVSGLDSMVVGEYQIVSQAKQAYALASEQGTTGRVLNRLFHQAFSASKRVRTETEIGRRKVSIPSVAVDIASHVFKGFDDKRTLVVGAGDMAQLVCEHLRSAKAEKFVITSRTLLNAKALAEACDGVAVPMSELDEQMTHADIVVTATACPKPILTQTRMRAIQKQRRGRPLFMIDLAVPRNIEPTVGQLDQVFLYDVDGMGKIVEENQRERINQVESCEAILDQEVESFQKWLGESLVKPLIVQMYDDAHKLRDAEVEAVYRRCPDLTDQQRRAIDQLAERLIGKFMHPWVSTIREHRSSAPSARLVDAFHAAMKARRRRDKGDD